MFDVPIFPCMIQSVLIKILLAPFSLLYGMGVSLHQFFYRKGLLKSVEFSIPVISVGNLSVGGAGKTPHIEYLIRLLKDYIQVATLSRGYKRKSQGFRVISRFDSALEAGDEPLQFHRKFPEVLVTVGESRSFGIPEILKHMPGTQAVLLDDAYQHLAVRPGLNILLTEYDRPYADDYLLPSGRLREWRSGYERADVIIVSKCPDQLSELERDAMLKKLKPLPHQQVFFSRYRYGRPYYLFNPSQSLALDTDMDVLLVSAIANTEYLTRSLQEQVRQLFSREFEDHHYFSNFEMGQIAKHFELMEHPRKIILTTEKDATRMELHRDFLLEKKLPVFVLPVFVEFLFDEGPRFDALAKDFLLRFKI